MSNFAGYFLKFTKPDSLESYTVPGNYIITSSYKASPDMRTELYAIRDGNNLLHRVTSPNFKTKIEFETSPAITLQDRLNFVNGIKKGLINQIERKFYVQYWNDDDFVLNYKYGYFYMPDPEYKILKVEANEIYYDKTRIALIEY